MVEEQPVGQYASRFFLVILRRIDRPCVTAPNPYEQRGLLWLRLSAGLSFDNLGALVG